MARFSDKPKRSGILPAGDEEVVKGIIKKLFNRALQWHCQNDITRDELEEFLVPAQYRQLARDAVAILEHSPSRRFYIPSETGPEIQIVAEGLNWEFPARKKHTHPKCAAWGKLQDWTERRVELGKQWGLVREVFSELNERCTRKDYLRFYWPPIVTLLGNTKTAEALAEWKPCSNPTPIPVGLRLACKETMNTIAMAALLPDHPPEEVGPIVLSATGLLKGEHPWALGSFYDAM